MMEPQIINVDRETFYSGRPMPHLWTTNRELKFYDFACNWGVNDCTQRFYQVLAYSWEQAKDMARSEYARTCHISKDWVEVF